MERLTSEKETKEMNMLELSQNCMYVKDDWCRYRDYNIDVGLIDFIVEISNKLGGNIITADGDYEVISEELWNNLQCGYDNIDGIIALLYTRLAALANLRRRLKEYEDLKLTPEQIREIDNLYSEQAKELREYKDAEKKDLLMRLPCKVGDSLYQLTGDIVSEFVVGCIEVSTCHHLFFHTKLVKGVNMTGKIFSQDEIGKTVFLTKDQAEATLEEMEGKKK